jgi:hypothetical protein
MSSTGFRKDAPFCEQRDYVTNLPRGNHPVLSPVVNNIQAQASPFSTASSDVPSGVEARVFHHALTTANQTMQTAAGASSNNDSDSDDDAPDCKNTAKGLTDAVVTRVLQVAASKRKEKMTLHLRDLDKLITVRLNADGTARSVRVRDAKFATYAKDLEKDTGIVVEATETKTQSKLYTTYTRDRSQDAADVSLKVTPVVDVRSDDRFVVSAEQLKTDMKREASFTVEDDYYSKDAGKEVRLQPFRR